MLAFSCSVNLSKILFITSRHSSVKAFTNYRIHSMSEPWLMAWVSPAGKDGGPPTSAPVWLCNLWQLSHSVSSSVHLPSVKWGCKWM